MAHTVIEMDTMRAQINALKDVKQLVEVQTRQAEALERIATTVEELQAFLHGTTIKQVEDKRKDLKNKNRKKGKSSEKAKIAEAKAFLDKQTEC